MTITATDYPVKYLDSDMADAPQLSGTDVNNGSPMDLYNFFKAVLVDGFGSGDTYVAPFGWSILIDTIPDAPYDGESYQYLVVFANANDTCFLELEITTPTVDYMTRVNYHMNARAYSKYISYDNKSSALDGYGSLSIGSSSTTYQLKDWVMIGGAKGFYLGRFIPQIWNNLYRTGTYSHSHMYIGELKSFFGDSETETCCFRFHKNNGNSDYGWNDSFIYSWTTSKFTAGALQNLDNSGATTYKFQAGNLYSSYGRETTAGFEEPTVMTPVMLMRGGSSSAHVDLDASPYDSRIAPPFRGFVAGLVGIDKAICCSDANFPIPNVQFLDGVQHFQLPTVNDGQSLVWINCEEW